MKQAYERLGIEEFGRQLLTTGDLDPLYIALARAGLSVGERARWLVAYWCFYHAGASSFLCQYEGPEFWSAMMRAAVNQEASPLGGRWPRAAERRHFRGQQACAAVDQLTRRYGSQPERMVSFIAASHSGMESQSFGSIAARVAFHKGFGPWISFKVADMLDALNIMPVRFDRAEVFMYETPRASALALSETMSPRDGASEDDRVRSVLEYLQAEFSDLRCPHRMDRGVEMQELETVLCKHKSHMKGHYPLLNDIREISHGLAEWAPVSQVARQLLAAMPTGEALQ
jgi:hypothetical protein